jgi:predicted metalloendopeptidase
MILRSAQLCILCAALTIGAAAAEKPAAQLRSGIDLQYVDRSVRPQADFYRYVNGRWLDSVQIPADEERITPSAQLNDVIRTRLRDLVEQAARSSDAAQRKLADFYASYLDESAVQKLGLQPLARDLAAIEAIADRAQLCAAFNELGQIWVRTPFTTSVLNDPDRPSEYALFLYQSGLGLPARDYYLDDSPQFKDARRAYVTYIATLLGLAGDANAQQTAASIMELETRLAKVHWSARASRDAGKTNNRVAIAQLRDVTDKIDWRSLLQGFGLGGRIDTVIIGQTSYFVGLGELLHDVRLTTWKSYLRYQLLAAYAPYLGREFVDADFALRGTALRGIKENAPRSRRALELIDETMGEVLGSMYVARYFPPANKARLQEMANNVVAALGERIEAAAWLSPPGKRAALAKLHATKVKIGYPDRWRDYGALRIERGDLVGNVQRARAFGVRYFIAKLGTPMDRDEWYITPQTVDAYGYPPLNDIVFPAGLMQPPFFDPAADDAVNYGAIGATIGHELSHGFDDVGSQYGADGAFLGKPGWFTAEERAQFDARGQALVEQYGAIEALPGQRIDGRLTLGENIADNAGLALAYAAYHKSLQGKPAPVIDGLSGEQRLFMGWTQKWRAKVRDAETLRILKSDEHSPRWVRGSAPLRNQNAFYEAFRVRAGDPMYLPPEKRVTVW